MAIVSGFINFLKGLTNNKAFVASFFGFFASQLLKTLIYKDIRVFGRYGGMPSSHVATTSALAWAIALTTGYDSPYTAIAGIFMAITTADAVGIRRKVDPNSGHTLLEVISGFFLGMIVAFVTIKIMK